jgi:hypothetical protein
LFIIFFPTTSICEKWILPIVLKGVRGPVTNAKNIKADSPKILRPTHFSCTKDIKADSFLALTNINANMFESG